MELLPVEEAVEHIVMEPQREVLGLVEQVAEMVDQ